MSICGIAGNARGRFSYMDEVREVAHVVLEGAHQAVIRVVGDGAVQLRVEVRLHEVHGDVARFFMLVVLGLQHVRQLEAFVRSVLWVDIATRCWAPHRLGFSAGSDGGSERGQLVQKVTRRDALPPVGWPVLGRAGLVEWTSRRFASSIEVAPLMTFSPHLSGGQLVREVESLGSARDTTQKYNDMSDRN